MGGWIDLTADLFVTQIETEFAQAFASYREYTELVQEAQSSGADALPDYFAPAPVPNALTFS